VSRLKGYKRADIAVEAFNMLGSKLKMIGSGEDSQRLEKIAGGNIEFLGRIKDEELLDLYSAARALIFTGKEDFSLTPVEAQASGTPAIAFCRGGASEMVIDGETGISFHEQTPESIVDAVRLFEKSSIRSVKCRENALKFDMKHKINEIISIEFHKKLYLSLLGGMTILFAIFLTEKYFSATTMVMCLSVVVSLALGLIWQEGRRDVSE